MKDKESIRVDWNLFSADVEEEYSVTEKTMVFELQSESARPKAVEREVARKLIWALQAVHNGILPCRRTSIWWRPVPTWPVSV